MEDILKCFILIFLCGVFGDPDEVKSVSVYEGDSVTLQTDTIIKKDDKILWRFGEEGSANLLVQMLENKIFYEESFDEGFKDRLQISDTQTGDLKINNMRIKYSGLYEAEIQTGSGSLYKKFVVAVNETLPVTDAGPSNVKSVSVTEGESVTLHTDVQIQRGDLIVWRFGNESVLIAKGDMEDNTTSVYDGADGSFRDRLKLNDQTGDLIITDSKTKHSGVYQLKISNNNHTLYKTFSVIISGAGWSSGAVAGLCIFLILLVACIVGLILYLCINNQSGYHSSPGGLESCICCCLIACIAACIGLRWYLRKKQSVQQIVVYVGESVTLHTAGFRLFTLPDDIEWKYGYNEVIAKINRENNTFFTYDGADGRFKSRLKLDNETGDLTIRNLKTKHSGLYQVKTSNEKNCQFNVTVTERIKQVEFGGTITLHTDVNELQKDDLILWMYGAEDIHIARFIGGTERAVIYDYTDDRFSKRLEMNPQTGDLTLINITPEHSGIYKALICTKQRSKYRRFKVSIIGLNSKHSGLKSRENCLATALRLSNEGIDFKEETHTATVYAEKGGSVGLKTGAQIQSGDWVEWSFRDDPLKRTSCDKITLVTGVNGNRYQTKYLNKKGRLEMNAQTGNLTIRKFEKADVGNYTLQLNKADGKNIQFIFNVVFDSARSYGTDSVTEMLLLNEEEV